jgi:hypothetical protein
MEDIRNIVNELIQHYENLIYQARQLGDPEPDMTDWDRELSQLGDGFSHDSGWDAMGPLGTEEDDGTQTS